MGLDMYLYANSKRTCKDALRAMNDTQEWKDWYAKRGIAMYWRKANAIHNWFVENVQGGEDDCHTYDVEPRQLVELRDLCKQVIDASKLVEQTECDPYGSAAFPVYKVIEDPSVAEELLPTTSGFFFGSTAYDEYYLADLEYTANAIQKMLEHVKEVEPYRFEHERDRDWYVNFQYHSSW